MRAPLHWLKPLVFIACLLPALWVSLHALSGTLGVNPVESLHHAFGDWTLRFLLLTLLITPLRLVSGFHWVTHLRRMLGLYAFFYATLHLGVYLMLDQQFDWRDIWSDITRRPYIMLGISAYLLMLPLVITSNRAMKTWLGNYWKRLHQLIYLITLLGILHFYLLVKADTREPALYLLFFAVLITLRIVFSGRRAQKHAPYKETHHHWT